MVCYWRCWFYLISWRCRVKLSPKLWLNSSINRWNSSNLCIYDSEILKYWWTLLLLREYFYSSSLIYGSIFYSLWDSIISNNYFKEETCEPLIIVIAITLKNYYYFIFLYCLFYKMFSILEDLVDIFLSSYYQVFSSNNFKFILIKIFILIVQRFSSVFW